MKTRSVVVLLYLLLLAGIAQAQIGTADFAAGPYGNASLGNGDLIGKSTLPVCTPVAPACSVATYIFTGTGYWNVSANWLAGAVPPPVLPAGEIILIDPLPGGECLLNVAQTISAGATLKLPSGKRLRVISSLVFLK